MRTTVNILVTGCGGDIGQSIGKILSASPLIGKNLGCDMSTESAAKFIFDSVLTIPACSSKDYFPSLKAITSEYAIDFILPTSEEELRFFASIGIENDLFGVPLIWANSKSRAIGFDKFMTVKTLSENGLPFPDTYILKELLNPKLPLVLKNRNGAGSKSVFIADTLEDYLFYQKKYPEFLAQEYLNNADEEYTCALFRGADLTTRSIIYKRRLTNGYSSFGTVTINVEIENLLNSIADLLDLRGSINVQLRLTEKGPCVFEINPRFSSTVKFRHMMGFEDVIWSIQDTMGVEIPTYIQNNNAKNFYKGFYEYID